MTVGAKYWCKARMQQYHFASETQRLLLDNCVFEMDDPTSTAGGGWCQFTGDWRGKTVVHLNTAQHEAAVHEMAHAWWYLIETDPTKPNRKDRLVGRLIEYFLRQSDKPSGRYYVVRNLCKEYRYGNNNGFDGMWMGEPYNRWNHDEIFAGLASGTMGDLHMFPWDLRRIYSLMFTYGEAYSIHMPLVMNNE